MRQRVRRGSSELAGDAPERLGGDFGERRCPFRRVGRDFLRQLIKAERVRRDEFMVVEVFADDDVEQRQMESQIGAGLDRQPFRCFGGGLGEARVKIDDLRAALDRCAQFAGLRGGDGFHQVAPGQDDVLKLVVVDARRFFHAVGHQVGDDHGVEAETALRAVVGRTEGVEQVFELRLAEVVGRRKDHRLRAVLLLDFEHLAGGQVERFVPGGLTKLAFAALADADQRRQNAVGVVGVHQPGLAAHAKMAFGMRMFGVAVELDDAPVFHFGDQAAAPDAHLAHAGDVAVATGGQQPGVHRRLRDEGREQLADRQRSGGGRAKL